jgi:hypothetical protein
VRRRWGFLLNPSDQSTIILTTLIFTAIVGNVIGEAIV